MAVIAYGAVFPLSEMLAESYADDFKSLCFILADKGLNVFINEETQNVFICIDGKTLENVDKDHIGISNEDMKAIELDEEDISLLNDTVPKSDRIEFTVFLYSLDPEEGDVIDSMAEEIISGRNVTLVYK